MAELAERTLELQISDLIQFTVGQNIYLKKVHPCGGYQWTVYRIGADIGIECMTCSRRTLFSRKDIEGKLKPSREVPKNI